MYRRKKWQRELQKHNIEKGCCICGSLFHALMMADTVARSGLLRQNVN